MEPVKIVCVTYADYDAIFKQIIGMQTSKNVEIIYYLGYLEDLEKGYERWLSEGVAAIIASGANFGLLSTFATIPVFNVQIHMTEYIRALHQAHKNKQPVVLPFFKETPIFSLEALQSISEVPLEAKAFDSQEGLEAIIIASKGKTVIGGCLAKQYAEKHVVDFVLLLPDEEAIAGALLEAVNFSRNMIAEKRKRDLLEAVVDHSVNGILSVDRQGRLLMVNPSARQQLNLKHNAFEMHLNEALPSFSELHTNTPVTGSVVRFDEKSFVVHWIPFETDCERPPGVFIFQSTSSVVDTERRIRRSTRKDGLYAKATFENILGECDLLRAEIKRAKLYSISDSNVLIYGETGVGKELFAQSIHRYSNRKDGPFVAVNCAAIPNALLESELFGYEEGAFTGSKRGGKAGLFELAHGGTLFLDEIGEIDTSVQARLLRVIQEKEVMRVGGDCITPIDVRIISATNARLIDKLPNAFREDLFYRLDVLNLNIPPLRARGRDIHFLFVWFLKRYLSLEGMRFQLPEVVKWILGIYAWPGNIRELQSVVERFAIQYKQLPRTSNLVIQEILVNAIGEEKLSKLILKDLKYDPEIDCNHKQKTKRVAEILEKAFPGRKQFIADQMGLSRTTLWRRCNDRDSAL